MKRRQTWFGALLLGVVLALAIIRPTVSQTLFPVTVQEPQGRAMLERLRRGGLVLFFRHADTTSMPCDSTYSIGDRPGQRNLSPEGRQQSCWISEALRRLQIPAADPVLAGPVFRARDTTELAFALSGFRSRIAFGRTTMPVDGCNGSWTSTGG